MEQQLLDDIIQWDVKAWSRALHFWENKVEWNAIHNALELGAREGGLSLWLAMKGKEVTCSDFKDTLITASPLHQKYSTQQKITYTDIDASNIPFENHFDLVVFKSIIGGIGHGGNYEKQKKVFHEIYKALKPGGKLLFAENLTGSSLHRHLRKKYVKWASDWRYISLRETSELMKEFKNVTLKTSGILGTMGRNEKQRNLLTTIDHILLNTICPRTWKYFCYGIAEK